MNDKRLTREQHAEAIKLAEEAISDWEESASHGGAPPRIINSGKLAIHYLDLTHTSEEQSREIERLISRAPISEQLAGPTPLDTLGIVIESLIAQNESLSQRSEEQAKRIAELEASNLGLRKRIHATERHNQYFERCESAWCNPHGNEYDPASQSHGDAFAYREIDRLRKALEQAPRAEKEREG